MPFRRRLGLPHKLPASGNDTVPDMTRFGGSGEPADDFRHRMLVNLAAIAVLVALIAGGVWLAFKLADLRKNQNCALSGGRGCAPAIEVPARDRW